MTLGYIISDYKDFKVSCFYEVRDFSWYKENKTEKPVLIIGRKHTEELFPDAKLTYTDRRLTNNIYWTFSRFEKRNLSEYDIKTFTDIITERSISSIRYVSFDFLYQGFQFIKRFIKFMNGKLEKTVYVSKNNIYIYSNGTIYGISLADTRWIGINDDKLITRIMSCNNVDVVFKSNLEDSQVLDEKYIPYIYYIDKQY